MARLALHELCGTQQVNYHCVLFGLIWTPQVDQRGYDVWRLFVHFEVLVSNAFLCEGAIRATTPVMILMMPKSILSIKVSAVFYIHVCNCFSLQSGL